MVFNEQRFVFFIYRYFFIRINITYFSIIRDNVVYPEIRLNDNDRFSTNCRDAQSQKNSSFPPISHDSQKQNSGVRYKTFIVN